MLSPRARICSSAEYAFIQAKRWTGVVGLESVHALTGVMADHNATTAVLVTTSWFGRASEEFAKRNRITLINGAEPARTAPEANRPGHYMTHWPADIRSIGASVPPVSPGRFRILRGWRSAAAASSQG